MKVMRKVGIAVFVGLMLVGLSGCSYNTFVSQEEAIKTQWAQVENQLQRRNDLIPNLVETVKGISQQEKDVFGQIADSRAKLEAPEHAAYRLVLISRSDPAHVKSRKLFLSDNFETVRELPGPLDYDPRERPWYKDAQRREQA